MVQAIAAALAVALTVIAMPALAASERQIRRDCRSDALRYCLSDAMGCLPIETKKCRAAVTACMVANKNNLSEQCGRHIR